MKTLYEALLKMGTPAPATPVVEGEALPVEGEPISTPAPNAVTPVAPAVPTVPVAPTDEKSKRIQKILQQLRVNPS